MAVDSAAGGTGAAPGPRVKVVDRNGHSYSCDSVHQPPMYIISKKRKAEEVEGEEEEDEEEEDIDLTAAGDGEVATEFRAAVYGTVERSLSLTPQILTSSLSARDGKVRHEPKKTLKKTMFIEEDEVPRGMAFRTTVAAQEGRLADTRARERERLQAAAQAAAQQRAEAQLNKAERMEKSSLLTVLFSLFASQERYTLKVLREKTNQPLVWLKQVLAEICDFNSSGPHKDTYELKQEYKGRTQEEQSAAAAAASGAAAPARGTEEEEWM
jgi:transcription initiation factor TFIIF subunit beta